jgi:hypothetical protein
MEGKLQRQHEVLTQQTGVEPSFNEAELKQYLYETIQEIKRSSIRH